MSQSLICKFGLSTDFEQRLVMLQVPCSQFTVQGDCQQHYGSVAFMTFIDCWGRGKVNTGTIISMPPLYLLGESAPGTAVLEGNC